MTHPDSTSRTQRGLALAPLFVASTLGLIAPRMAAAQSEAPDCIAIVADMLTPTPSAGSIRASAGCPTSGPVTLANRWARQGPRSATERAALVDASSLMRDARIYETVLGLTRDESRPVADRLAGIRVLLGYADDGVGVIQQGQSLAPRPTSAPKARAASSPTLVQGSVTFTPDMRSEVKRELYRLAAVDRDPDVRSAAKKASASLGYIVPRTDNATQQKTP
ncbi:MAG TPA: hypothetical protein VJT85_00180 [Gemmatimonadaceae bacterium]|nr:hypothetical protein [Gemmatimonadaceae bacterium]